MKTTYRRFNEKGELLKFNFTGGSFTSYMRNGTKNINGQYDDYEKHYILGVLYSREKNPTVGQVSFEKLDSIVPAYKNPEVFVQEKYRICGDKKGSGNTDNIATIKSNIITPFEHGAGPFSFLGKEAFHDYWINHPRYKDSKKIKNSLYGNISDYIKWLREKQNKAQLADEYEKRYKEYKIFLKKKNW